MTAPIHVGSEEEMLALLRARISQLGISHGTLDAIAGLQDGYASKILADPPIRRPGPMTLALVLAALGYKMELQHDEEALAAVQRRLEHRNRKGRHKRAAARTTIIPYFSDPVNAHLAGVKRWSSTTPQQRSRIAKRAAKKRWNKPRISLMKNRAAAT
jgi:hypothetical protein